MRHPLAKKLIAVVLSIPLALLLGIPAKKPPIMSDPRMRDGALPESNDIFCCARAGPASNSLSLVAGDGRSGSDVEPFLAALGHKTDEPRAAPGSIFADFNRWIEEYVRAAPEQTDPATETRGESLARARRQVLARLIESDPERA